MVSITESGNLGVALSPEEATGKFLASYFAPREELKIKRELLVSSKLHLLVSDFARLSADMDLHG